MAYCFRCNKIANQRLGLGPTGRKKTWIVLCDVCWCERAYPLEPRKLTFEQASWFRRRNRKIGPKSD